MVEWSLIIYCGLVTFFSRFLMIAILKKEMFTDRIREVLSFVPSAVFPAIIFPAIFLDTTGNLIIENNPKAVDDYIAGKEQSKKFLLGQVMKETKGQADPRISMEIISKILESKK